MFREKNILMPTTNTCMGIYSFVDSNIKRFESIIKPLVEIHTGLKYVDARYYYESQSIKMDLISRMIEDSNLVIVDLSEKNQNVFLELGIAYALKKPRILLCLDEHYKKTWKKKMPFDIEGHELLIFKDEKELKVKLGRFISDSLFKTKHITVSWDSENARNHLKSASEFEIFDSGGIWSNVGIKSSFMISYHVKIHDLDSNKKPDIRLFFSSNPDGYPRIVSIFPWEYSENAKNKLECHIDYFQKKESGSNQENHLRLQQIPVANGDIESMKEFDVFVSFCWPNMVFESSHFEDGIDRIYVSLSRFKEIGFPIHLDQYIGFEAKNNCHVTISDIAIKQIYK